MQNLLRFIKKGWRILSRRLREQGLKTTLIWIYGRGIPKLTGVPLLQFSRVTPQLYVGPQYGKRGKALLEREGIHYGVNLRIEFDDAAHGLALQHYLHLPTVDDDAPTLEQLEQGATFIHQAIEAGGKVYIHCAGGVGRAPTTAAAYLIKSGMTLEQALSTIRKVRPFISIMPPQMDILKQYEANLAGEKTR
ncbi:MAG: protein phosphatase [Chloroflexi bacterium]|nr:MAG: protein phosphatase [Chloroflexota bacterium]